MQVLVEFAEHFVVLFVETAKLLGVALEQADAFAGAVEVMEGVGFGDEASEGWSLVGAGAGVCGGDAQAARHLELVEGIGETVERVVRFSEVPAALGCDVPGGDEGPCRYCLDALVQGGRSAEYSFLYRV